MHALLVHRHTSSGLPLLRSGISLRSREPLRQDSGGRPESERTAAQSADAPRGWRGFVNRVSAGITHKHHHSGLGLRTPAMVPYGQAPRSRRSAKWSSTPRTLSPRALRTQSAETPDPAPSRSGSTSPLRAKTPCLIFVDTHRNQLHQASELACVRVSAANST